MSPLALDPADLVRRLRRDAERSVLRTRNGIKYVSGIDRTQVGQTPKDTVWRRDKVELWRYRNDAVAHSPPVLFVHSLITRSYILDLYPGNSVVERFRDEGLDVFLVDWGVPDEADAENTLSTYVDGYLPRVVEEARRAARSAEVTVVGYCYGGILAALLAAAHPQLPIRNLVTMATPIDFHHIGLMADVFAEGRLEPDSVIDHSGNVPPDVLRNIFRTLKPTSDLAQYVNLWQNLWNDKYVEGFTAMAQWISDHVPFPGAVTRETVDHLVRDNALANGVVSVGGRRVRLTDVRCPLLNVMAEKDDIVPIASSEPLCGLVGSADAEELRLAAGHVGLVAGRQAAKETLPAIIDWIRRHSDDQRA